jgi:hypothetical protein
MLHQIERIDFVEPTPAVPDRRRAGGISPITPVQFRGGSFHPLTTPSEMDALRAS